MERIPEARMIELLLQKSSLHTTTDVRYAFVSRTLKYKLQKKTKSSHKKKYIVDTNNIRSGSL